MQNLVIIMSGKHYIKDEYEEGVYHELNDDEYQDYQQHKNANVGCMITLFGIITLAIFKFCSWEKIDLFNFKLKLLYKQDITPWISNISVIQKK